MQTVIALYERFEDAENAVRELRDSGFRGEGISVIVRDAEGKYSREVDIDAEGVSGAEYSGKGAAQGAGIGAALGGLGGLLVGLGALAIPGIGPVVAAGPIITTLAGAGIGAVSGGLIGALVEWGVPREHAETYAEGLRRGGTLVVVRVEERHGTLAAGILNRFNPIDIERKAQEWRESGGAAASRGAAAKGANLGMAPEDMPESPRKQEEAVPVTGAEREAALPVIEEELKVEHRQVDQGGVQINTRNEEQPIERELDLRRERIEAERTSVDREMGEGEYAAGMYAQAGQHFAAFEEGSIEFTEISEEPLVEKRARVVEEVRVKKVVDHEKVTLHDKLRRQEVEVEPIAPGERREYDPDFRRHFDLTYRDRGQKRSYEFYQPAYHFGRNLATDQRFKSKGYDWERLEPVAQHEWEQRGERSAWDEVRGAVRYGWQMGTR